MNNKISKEFAEILGLLCAEGSHIISYSSCWEINGLKNVIVKIRDQYELNFIVKIST